jgi:ribonucleoside-diphosphate reductase alpha chain
MAALEKIVPLAVRMLDNAIDISRFPLEAQKKEAVAKRRIGLGVTGLADALIMCGARYGGKQAVALTETWMKAIQRAAYLASAELAAEKGPFPLFDKEKYLAGPTIAALDEDIRAAIAAHGMRNALLTSVAPTGTISIFADNVSSGLEPVFSFTYTRNVLMPDGGRREEEVSDHAYRLYRRLKGANATLPDAFIDAQHLAPLDHVVMQAAVQKYVDASISKTINLPEDISFEDFKDVYVQAYELGCKGCTTYRPNAVTGAVLERDGKHDEADARQTELPLAAPVPRARDEYETGVVYMTQPLSRPEELPGKTYKIRWPESDHAIYITINDVVQDGRRRPFEVFINSKNMEHYAWTVALTRMISAVFRRGGDVSFVVEELKAVFDPRGGQWMGQKYVPSLLAAIGEVIETHMIDIGFLPAKQEKVQTIVEAKAVMGAGESGARGGGHVAMRGCPKCGTYGLIRQENCDVCTSCGYSKCS